MARVVAYNPRKRGREESSEPWRQLARTAPGTLLRVATSKWEGVNKCLKSTHRRLYGYNVVDMLRARDSGNRPSTPRGRTVDASHCKVKRFDFLRVCARLGQLSTGRRRRRRGAVACVGEAPRRGGRPRRRGAAGAAIRADGPHGGAVRILHVVSGKPPKFRARAWASEADRLVRRATDEVVAARHALQRMRRAVVLEFFDAWAVLSG
ncbi:hypothetical protein GQ55_5G484900 [Panicum hallii var. hallii]|uniref:Uncharacterized protein n=1 Tax=Panicum hallii var. hallii TaxID=1504633 RepID=A0A2T7DRD0_9POAL|nr:hypothetical protein GQ55_5G484900 [Panicum hallii var. hallii]